MGLHDIRFAPLHQPLERRLQTLAVALVTWLVCFSGVTAYLLFLYVFFYTRYYWLVLVYLAFWFGERGISYRGGRGTTSVRRWKLWTYLRDYFPMKLEKTVDLDASKNYLFCVFPHGVISVGVATGFGTEACGFSEIFAGITPYVTTLNINFRMPLIRDLFLALGFCSVAKPSMNYLLGRPGTGRATVLVVGGATESLLAKPGTYRVVLKRRKGFVAIALKHGVSLVPVVVFGENDMYDQWENPEGSWLRWVQDTLMRMTGVAPVIPIGRGLFQYSFGMLPKRTPVTLVVGTPLDVQKVPEPTQELIDDLHQRFTEHLVALFEEEKHKHLTNAQDVHLVIE